MLKAKDIMIQSVFYVKPNTPVHKAMEMLIEHNISGIPVVEEDMTLVGIISEKDILRFNTDLKDLINKPTSDFMTQPAIFFEENESILDVCQCLANNEFRRVPVTSSGTLVGVISRRDIISIMLKAAHAHT
ncbi:HPP family protein [Planctomycetota bacterium]